MSNKEKYRHLCNTESSIPFFSRAWWLDDVCGEDKWDVAIVEKGGHIYASMPYYLMRKNGFNSITMPPLTQTMGPWIHYPKNQKYEKRLSFEKEMMTALIEQLPDVAMIRQYFHYSVTNWLPFYWRGFQQTTRYTYIIEDLSNLDAVWKNTQSRVKTDINKARKRHKLRISQDCELARFIHVNRKTFARQGTYTPYNDSFLERLDNVCQRHTCRRIFLAEDDQSCVHAGIYLVWDENSAYYLMGGSDPELRNSGATSLLLWKAIQFAATVTKKFDFEGSMIESVEHYFRAFGAEQKPYFSISKTPSRLLRLGKALKQVFKQP